MNGYGNNVGTFLRCEWNAGLPQGFQPAPVHIVVPVDVEVLG